MELSDSRSGCSASDQLDCADSLEDSSSWTRLGLQEASDESFGADAAAWSAESVVEAIVDRCQAELAAAQPLSERSQVLQRVLWVHRSVVNKEAVTLPGFQVAGFAQGELTREALMHITVEEHAQLWQSLQQRLAAALQLPQTASCVVSELTCVLGLTMGLCLALMACNPAAMLRLQEAQLPSSSKQASSCTDLLDCLQLSEKQVLQVLGLRRQHWQRLGAAIRAQEHAQHALQAAVQGPPASEWPSIERASFLDTALQSGAALEQALKQQASILLERMWLLDEPSSLSPCQVAAMIVHSGSCFPDVVAFGEEVAKVQGGQASMEVLMGLPASQETC